MQASSDTMGQESSTSVGATRRSRSFQESLTLLSGQRSIRWQPDADYSPLDDGDDDTWFDKEEEEDDMDENKKDQVAYKIIICFSWSKKNLFQFADLYS